MGVILSKLRGKKEGFKEQLENVERELKSIQRFQLDTELSQKRTVGRIFVWSAILYIGAAVGIYFFVERSDWKAQSLCVLPFILFPILVWLVNRTIKWYYKRKITNNTDRYRELKQEKQRLLEDVMEFETFNNAKDILAKYDPDRLLPKYLDGMKSMNMSPTASPAPQGQQATGLRQRLQPRQLMASSSSPAPVLPGFTPIMRPILGGSNPPGQFLRQPINAQLPVRRAIMPSGAPGPGSSTPMPQIRAPGPGPMNQMMMGQPTPRYMFPAPPMNPILQNRSQGWMDKLVDYFVGDGPANRYALICRYCASHNGLATEEDFPYVGYRCARCQQFNPPRKVRPQAQRLPAEDVLIDEMENSNSNSRNTTAATGRSGSPIITHPDSSVAGSESGESADGDRQLSDAESSPGHGANNLTEAVNAETDEREPRPPSQNQEEPTSAAEKENEVVEDAPADSGSPSQDATFVILTPGQFIQSPVPFVTPENLSETEAELISASTNISNTNSDLGDQSTEIIEQQQVEVESQKVDKEIDHPKQD